MKFLDTPTDRLAANADYTTHYTRAFVRAQLSFIRITRPRLLLYWRNSSRCRLSVRILKRVARYKLRDLFFKTFLARTRR